jgi:hypothetical protein
LSESKVVQVADFLPKAMERFPDKGGSLFVRDERETDLARVKLNELEEMQNQVLRDMDLTPDQASITLESFDAEGKPVFTVKLKTDG